MCLQDEINFLTMIQLLSIKYDIVYDIDFENRTLNFQGDPSDEHLFLQELCDVMNEPIPINPS